MSKFASAQVESPAREAVKPQSSLKKQIVSAVQELMADFGEVLGFATGTGTQLAQAHCPSHDVDLPCGNKAEAARRFTELDRQASRSNGTVLKHHAKPSIEQKIDKENTTSISSSSALAQSLASRKAADAVVASIFDRSIAGPRERQS